MLIKKNKEVEKNKKSNQEGDEKEKAWKIRMDSYEYFITQNNEVCAKIEDEEHGARYIPVKSMEFKDRIRYESYKEMKSIKSDAINTMIEMIEAKARYEAKRIQSFIRVGEHKGRFTMTLEEEDLWR